MVQGLMQAAGGGAWSKLTRFAENKGRGNGRGGRNAVVSGRLAERSLIHI